MCGDFSWVLLLLLDGWIITSPTHKSPLLQSFSFSAFVMSIYVDMIAMLHLFLADREQIRDIFGRIILMKQF